MPIKVSPWSSTSVSGSLRFGELSTPAFVGSDDTEKAFGTPSIVSDECGHASESNISVVFADQEEANVVLLIMLAHVAYCHFVDLYTCVRMCVR